MNCQILFSGKNKKNILKCRLLKILSRVLSVNKTLLLSTPVARTNFCHDCFSDHFLAVALMLALCKLCAFSSISHIGVGIMLTLCIQLHF